MHLSPPRWLRLLSVLRRWFCCCWLFVYCSPIVGVCNCSMFCCTLLYVHSSIAIILMGKRELIALLNLSSWCLVMVERLFLAVPRGCLQFVIVVFPEHTHLLFLKRKCDWKGILIHLKWLPLMVTSINIFSNREREIEREREREREREVAISQ